MLAALARTRAPAPGQMLLHFKKPLLFRFGLNAWLSGRKKSGLWAYHFHGETSLLQIHLADTVMLQDDIHRAPQHGCDYFWDGFSVLLKSTVCLGQAAASCVDAVTKQQAWWETVGMIS